MCLCYRQPIAHGPWFSTLESIILLSQQGKGHLLSSVDLLGINDEEQVELDDQTSPSNFVFCKIFEDDIEIDSSVSTDDGGQDQGFYLPTLQTKETGASVEEQYFTYATQR